MVRDDPVSIDIDVSTVSGSPCMLCAGMHVNGSYWLDRLRVWPIAICGERPEIPVLIVFDGIHDLLKLTLDTTFR